MSANYWDIRVGFITWRFTTDFRNQLGFTLQSGQSFLLLEGPSACCRGKEDVWHWQQALTLRYILSLSCECLSVMINLSASQRPCLREVRHSMEHTADETSSLGTSRHQGWTWLCGPSNLQTLRQPLKEKQYTFTDTKIKCMVLEGAW